MPHAVRISTPTDFEKTIGSQEFLSFPLCSPLPEIEPIFRKAVSQIFNDLQDLDNSERDQVASFLSYIEEPLNVLRSLGFEIFAVTSTGKMRFPNGNIIPEWNRTYYLIVPSNGYFRIGKDLTGVVHRFDPNCETAVEELNKAAKDSTPIAYWANKEVVVQQLEANVPWCIECCFGE